MSRKVLIKSTSSCVKLYATEKLITMVNRSTHDRQIRVGVKSCKTLQRDCLESIKIQI